MRDMHSNIKVVLGVGSAVHAADNTPAAVDRQGYESAELILAVGIGGITFDASNKIEVKVTHSDDDSTYTAVAAADILGESSIGSGGIVLSLIAAHAAAAVYRLGYVGNKRYLKVLFDFTGTHGTGTPMSATWVLGNPHYAPVAAQTI